LFVVGHCPSPNIFLVRLNNRPVEPKLNDPAVILS
jgi:hypothetical protein